jgi:hypothetical protein
MFPWTTVLIVLVFGAFNMLRLASYLPQIVAATEQRRSPSPAGRSGLVLLALRISARASP